MSRGQGGGRPRKPTNLHVLQGTHRADRHGKIEKEPQPPAASGDVPKWLDADAKKVWRQYAPGLLADGLLTERDVEFFAHACALIAEARKLPVGGRDHLNVVAAADRLLAKYGFTPSDRAKIHITPQSSDPMDDLLGRRSS